jgi:recombination protein RecA
MEKEDKKKNQNNDTETVRDEMAVEIAEMLNKKSEAAKEGKIAFFLDEEESSPVLDWTSTGNSMLDLAISNRPNGGLPAGRIIELTGLESSGKSLLGAHFLAETQKKGGVGVYIDTEFADCEPFLRAIGVNVPSLNWVKLNTLEKIFDHIESIIAQVRKSQKNRPVGILVDSLAAATTEKELAADHGAEGYATGKAIIISKAMRKITELISTQNITLVFTNQLRQKIGFVGLGDPWTTSGGKAVAYHSSVRVRLKKTGQIKNIDKEVIGIKTKALIIKNRMGPPLRSVEFDIFFNRGIDNYGNWLQYLIDWDIVTNAKKVKDDGRKKKTKKELEAEKEEDKKAKSLQFTLPVEGKEPEIIQFEKRDFVKFLSTRPDVRKWFYDQLCERYIMKYKNADEGVYDDVTYEAPGEGSSE